MRLELKNYPLVILDEYIQSENHSGRFSQDLIKALQDNEMSVLIAKSEQDCIDTLAFSTNIIGVILAWDTFQEFNSNFDYLLDSIKRISPTLPLIIVTQSHELHDASTSMLRKDIHFFWKYGDTFDFIVGRIKKISIDYFLSLQPPFFKELIKYTEEYNYAWHTPGHMGGIAFLKSPVGRIFYDFYGENMFRSDLSISVPELGSLLDHSGVNGEAERFASHVFGSDHTFFVTNGTSTANKMVLMSCSGKGDVAIIDRNCHKSLQHALTMSDVTPIYFKPSRNAYGIIGTIPLSEFSQESISNKIKACPLIEDKSIVPRIAVITNSTYDGLIYDVNKIKDQLAKTNIPFLHFDEAWFAYAHFHSIYEGRYAMTNYHHDYHPTVYSTQSSHKLLAALSQASMIHIKDGKEPLNVPLFNETYMMHTSTSPQYAVVASLDVASKMMEEPLGNHMLSETIHNAIEFRQEFYRIKDHYEEKNDWFFDLWQPDAVLKIKQANEKDGTILQQVDAKTWLLNPKDAWHGFNNIDNDFILLDPIKVTILTPGIDMDAKFQDFGIPGPILSRYLIKDGVVDEKTSFYSLLFLFSIGVNKSNSMNLLNALMLFKEAYDSDAELHYVFPNLLNEHLHHYQNMSLKTLCNKMHVFLKKAEASQLLMRAFDTIPQQVITPNEAYQHIIKGRCTAYPLNELQDKVILSMIAPYPPGIPMVMPGEKITAQDSILIDYLRMLEEFDNTFPGFENDVHGVEVRISYGKRHYYVNCL